jgi:hypothetical protein
MKKPKVKTLPVPEAVHARVKQSANRCGEKQYIHAGKLIIDGFRLRAEHAIQPK